MYAVCKAMTQKLVALILAHIFSLTIRMLLLSGHRNKLFLPFLPKTFLLKVKQMCKQTICLSRNWPIFFPSCHSLSPHCVLCEISNWLNSILLGSFRIDGSKKLPNQWLIYHLCYATTLKKCSQLCLGEKKGSLEHNLIKFILGKFFRTWVSVAQCTTSWQESVTPDFFYFAQLSFSLK